MHPWPIREKALDLIAAGLEHGEVARRLGIPRRTVGDWHRASRSRQVGTYCFRCWRRTRLVRFTDEDYSLLLALYLGDGSISVHPRTQRLRITLDQRYPGIIEATRLLLARGFPENAVSVGSRASGGACVDVSVYSSHLSCLLPQHGPGAKHLRAIRLEAWQARILDRAPWGFITGCIWSDGCSFRNRTGAYEYLGYAFSNRSDEIAALFIGACTRAGVVTRLGHDRCRGTWTVRINRRDSVAMMLAQVGLKT